MNIFTYICTYPTLFFFFSSKFLGVGLWILSQIRLQKSVLIWCYLRMRISEDQSLPGLVPICVHLCSEATSLGATLAINRPHQISGVALTQLPVELRQQLWIQLSNPYPHSPPPSVYTSFSWVYFAILSAHNLLSLHILFFFPVYLDTWRFFGKCALAYLVRTRINRSLHIFICNNVIFRLNHGHLFC